MLRIFLIGYMGAGKTTLGKAFAKALELSFVDLDWYIEERLHRTIADLFAERGEDGFRLIEQAMLYEVAQFENVVISTGGGTPCFFDNMSYMNKMGITVHLTASFDVLFRRLSVARRQRPALRGTTDEELAAIIQQGVAKRAPFYGQAQYTFDGSTLESRSQIQKSVEALSNLLQVW